MMDKLMLCCQATASTLRIKQTHQRTLGNKHGKISQSVFIKLKGVEEQHTQINSDMQVSMRTHVKALLWHKHSYSIFFEYSL